jgi:DNA-directed RNA polymerase specialized sigma24 family protein
MTELLPEEVEPDPLYEQDDEEFWQLHELDHPRNAEVFSGKVDRVREDVADEDELAGRLAPYEREVFLMHEVHGVALQEIAMAVGLPEAEVERLLSSARHRLRAAGNMAR